MRTKIHIISWILLALAASAWFAVWYTGSYITNEASSRAAGAATAEQQLDRLAYAQRLDALATDTKSERDRLDVIMHADIVSIVTIIESTGKSEGARVHVSDALPIGSAQQLPGGARLQPVAFVVEAQGSFPALMRIVATFEHLPLPSAIDQLEFQHDSTAASKLPSWRLSARIRVFTTAVVSS